MTKAKGNMYNFITHTHNAVKGKCPHGCMYCYVNRINKRFNITPKEPYLDEKELKKNLGSGNIIFIGSSCDMWAKNIPSNFIHKTLESCNKYPKNAYVFQTKNPERFIDFKNEIPKGSHLGITIETNRKYDCMGNTHSPHFRSAYFKDWGLLCFSRFITIEPILDFDIDDFLQIHANIRPHYVNIGADSGNNRLPEPEPEKIRKLVSTLKTFTAVHLKPNLKRLLPEVPA
jgi:protein gp37